MPWGLGHLSSAIAFRFLGQHRNLRIGTFLRTVCWFSKPFRVLPAYLLLLSSLASWRHATTDCICTQWSRDTEARHPLQERPPRFACWAPSTLVSVGRFCVPCTHLSSSSIAVLARLEGRFPCAPHSVTNSNVSGLFQLAERSEVTSPAPFPPLS